LIHSLKDVIGRVTLHAFTCVVLQQSFVHTFSSKDFTIGYNELIIPECFQAWLMQRKQNTKDTELLRGYLSRTAMSKKG